MDVKFTVEWRDEKGKTFTAETLTPKGAIKIAISKLSVGYPHVFIRLRHAKADASKPDLIMHVEDPRRGT